jgi:hypothetical protein
VDTSTMQGQVTVGEAPVDTRWLRGLRRRRWFVLPHAWKRPPPAARLRTLETNDMKLSRKKRLAFSSGRGQPVHLLPAWHQKQTRAVRCCFHMDSLHRIPRRAKVIPASTVTRDARACHSPLCL